ncbi:hypothetical protein CVS40_5436 [Lucilia cuprina]|nr:hypothetical protein CVS40_5436 [Lucilia cuprina]
MRRYGQPIKRGFVLDFGCSHGPVAYEIIPESVLPGNEELSLGVRCSSLSKLNKWFCTGEGYPMGFAVPTDLRGLNSSDSVQTLYTWSAYNTKKLATCCKGFGKN